MIRARDTSGRAASVIDEDARVRIIAVYEQTGSMPKTALEVGVGYGSVQRTLVAAGVSRRSYRGEVGETKHCRDCGEDKPVSEFVGNGRVGTKNTCDGCRAARIRQRVYGISPEQYDEMVRRQQGRCAICRQKPRKGFHVDHDHETGRVRGLLCRSCNHGLGNFKDAPGLLRAAISYLAAT